MQLVQACDAIRISGLSQHQLREWCGRRGVVVPDQPPAGRGRHALYSWQTILALRLLKELHDRFGVEVSAWGRAIAVCQSLLQRRPFPSLWGTAIVFTGMDHAELVTDGSPAEEGASLRLPLDPHLTELASTFASPEMTQLPLFAALAVTR
jgi:MerR HTH family regulatory protein